MRYTKQELKSNMYYTDCSYIGKSNAYQDIYLTDDDFATTGKAIRFRLEHVVEYDTELDGNGEQVIFNSYNKVTSFSSSKVPNKEFKQTPFNIITLIRGY